MKISTEKWLFQPRSAPQWRIEGGGQGGHGPRAQALEGAPAQLVGANFKSRSFWLKTFFLSFFFLLVDFCPRAKGFGFTKGGRQWRALILGGGAPMQALAPRALETLGTPLPPNPLGK